MSTCRLAFALHAVHPTRQKRSKTLPAAWLRWVYALWMLGAFACTTALATTHARSQAGLSWNTYVNVRFGYSGCYPANLLVAGGESANSDGQRFESNDGAILLMYGSNNIANRTLSAAFKEELHKTSASGGKVTYSHSTPRMYVVSGFAGSQIFYEKSYISDRRFKTMRIEYPLAVQAKYAPIAARLSRCFHDNAKRPPRVNGK